MTDPAATDTALPSPVAWPGDGAGGREPALAVAIADAVAGSRTRRVYLTSLLGAAAGVDRSGAVAVGWRGRVRAALEDLRDAGVLTWPATRFDNTGVPALPAYVSGPAAAAPPGPERRGTVWCHQLAWAGSPDAGLNPTELALLARVNDWLARADTTIVPLRERSLDVFDDEKLLETLLLGPLFGPGRLSLGMLAAESCWPEVVQTRAGTLDDWLIVENYTTYISLSRRAEACGFPDRVIWGSGNQVSTRLATLAVNGERPGRAWYFGDIDTGGFKVARTAVARAAELGLGGVAPAHGLYRLALELGTPRHTRSSPARERAQSWVRFWLGEELGAACAQIAGAGDQIVQEHVGTAALAGIDLRRLLEG